MQTGSTSGAARMLHISQPAVSNMIRHTEDSIGFKLFNRVHGRLTPTDEAVLLFERSGSIFDILSDIQKLVADLERARVGTLRISATPSIGHTVTPIAVRNLLDSRPEISIRLNIGRRETVFESVENRTSDLGITLTYRQHPSVSALPIYQGQIVCVVRSDDPLAELETVRPSDLRGRTLVRLERGTVLADIVDGALSGLGEDIKWSVETRYCQTACLLVDRGHGIALVDEYVVRANPFGRLVVRPFLPSLPVTAYILYPNWRPLSNLAKLFIEEMKTALLNS